MYKYVNMCFVYLCTSAYTCQVEFICLLSSRCMGDVGQVGPQEIAGNMWCREGLENPILGVPVQ